MSRVMRGFHGRLQVGASGDLVRDPGGEPMLIDCLNPQPSEQPLVPTGLNTPMEASCFPGHPGKITQCFRGVMFTAGRTCVSCHGGMLAVGGAFSLLSDSEGEARDTLAAGEIVSCDSCHSLAKSFEDWERDPTNEMESRVLCGGWEYKWRIGRRTPACEIPRGACAMMYE